MVTGQRGPADSVAVRWRIFGWLMAVETVVASAGPLASGWALSATKDQRRDAVDNQDVPVALQLAMANWPVAVFVFITLPSSLIVHVIEPVSPFCALSEGGR